MTAAERTESTSEVPTEPAETATFAAGCFWGVEERFRRVPGVLETTVGYTGGTSEQPSYEDVCSGRTGHAEAVQIRYDPQVVTYGELLQVFWACHDPTTLDRQGPDIGTQYRSAIFFQDAGQQAAARASMAEAQRHMARPIVTRIVPAGRFWPAEEYHQHYLEKRASADCRP